MRLAFGYAFEIRSSARPKSLLVRRRVAWVSLLPVFGSTMQDVRDAIAHVFVVGARRAPRTCNRAGSLRVAQDDWSFIEANHRCFRIERSRVHAKDVLHPFDELSVDLGHHSHFFSRHGLRSCSAKVTRMVSLPTRFITSEVADGRRSQDERDNRRFLDAVELALTARTRVIGEAASSPSALYRSATRFTSRWYPSTALAAASTVSPLSSCSSVRIRRHVRAESFCCFNRFSSLRSEAVNFKRGGRAVLAFTPTLRSRNRVRLQEQSDHNRPVGARRSPTT